MWRRETSCVPVLGGGRKEGGRRGGGGAQTRDAVMDSGRRLYLWAPPTHFSHPPACYYLRHVIQPRPVYQTRLPSPAPSPPIISRVDCHPLPTTTPAAATTEQPAATASLGPRPCCCDVSRVGVDGPTVAFTHIGKVVYGGWRIRNGLCLTRSTLSKTMSFVIVSAASTTRSNRTFSHLASRYSLVLGG